MSWPWASEEEYAAWYAGGGYHGEEQIAQQQAPTGARDQDHQRAAVSRLRLMTALGLSGSLLDVGAGMGAFVGAASAHGWQAVGVEPCAAMVAAAQGLGRNVQQGTTDSLPDGPFGMITMLDVLEHLTRPAAALLAMRERLAPGGCILVEMPVLYAPLADWRRHIRPRQHVCLFSAPAAQALFSRCGLVTESVVRPLGGTLAKAMYFLRAA